MKASRIDFYSKDGCSLCDDARPMVQDVAKRYGLSWREHDIRGSMELFMRYRYQVPVLEIDGHAVMSLRFDAAELERIVAAASSGSAP